MQILLGLLLVCNLTNCNMSLVKFVNNIFCPVMLSALYSVFIGANVSIWCRTVYNMLFFNEEHCS